MLEKLQALTNREPGDLWRVKNGSIVKYSGKKHRVQNLVDFVRSIKLATQEAKTLPKDDVERITEPLLEVAFSLQERISKLPAWKRLFLNVVQYLSTGTSLYQETKLFVDLATKLKHVNPVLIVKAQHPQLVKDAEQALTSRAAYNEIAKKYPLSHASLRAKEAFLLPLSNLTNPLLISLRQASLSYYRKMQNELRLGKSLENPDVMQHAQSALYLGKLLVQLAVSHELENVHEMGKIESWESASNKKERFGIMLRDQATYSFWAVLYFGQLYTNIRLLGANAPQQFFQEGTPTSYCRNIYNEGCEAIANCVDLHALNVGEKLDFIPGHKATSPDNDIHWADKAMQIGFANLQKSMLNPNW